MTVANKIVIASMTFTIAFAVLYTICTEFNLPLLTYHPAIGQVDFLRTPERRGPAMYWYGWMLTSLIGATVVAAIASVSRETWLQRAIAFGTIVAIGYLVVYTLALFVYDRATIELEFLKSRWYAAIAALVIAALISYRLPAKWNQRLWPGWVSAVPIGALAVLAYYLSPYFTR